MSKTCKWCGITTSNTSCIDFDANGRNYEICDSCVSNLANAKSGRLTVDEIAFNNTDPDLKEFFKKKYESKNKSFVTSTVPSEPKPIVARETVSSRSNVFFGAESAIWQIAEDVRFLRNVVLVSLILACASLFLSLIMSIVAAAG